MADSWYGDSGDWLNAAMAWYLNQQNNKDPKFHEIPMSESERWRFDRGKELFDYSPTRDYVGSYAHQALQGNSRPLQMPTFRSNYMQGQSFMGGYQMPQIDFSQMPQYWKPGYQATNRTNTPSTPTTRPDVGGGSGAGGGGNGGNDFGAVEMNNDGGRRLPTVAGVGGQGIGGFTSGSEVKGYNDPTYGDLNRQRTGPPAGNPFFDGNLQDHLNRNSHDMGGRLSSGVFFALVRQYGKGAAEMIAGLMMKNPALTLKGAMDLWRASQGGNQTQNPPGGKP